MKSRTTYAVLVLAVAASGLGLGADPSSPPTRADRVAAAMAVFGREGPLPCLNPVLGACSGNVVYVAHPAIRGVFVVRPDWTYSKDLVSAAEATAKTLSFTIRSDAYWYWGKRRLPVTYRDFVYTWKTLGNPTLGIATGGQQGYLDITGYTHRGEKQITFRWRKPFGQWKFLFDYVLPSAALAGTNFAKAWQTCICGSDGKPVSDGPFYVASHSRSGVTTLETNPYWYGTKPGLKKLVFVPLATPAAELAAARRGTIDIVSPTSSYDSAFTYGPWVKEFMHIPGMRFVQVPSMFAEHIDMQFGPKGNPLLRSPWFRQAIATAIDRDALIARSLGPLATGIERLDNLLYPSTDRASRRDFARWRHDPARAFALLKAHCTGGPPAPTPGATAVWTCGGIPATLRFLYLNTNPFRVAAYPVLRAQLARVGIALGDGGLGPDDYLGANGLTSSDYDLVEFAWGGFDPANYGTAWTCRGATNYLNYCNQKVSSLLQAGENELDPARRLRIYRRADALLAGDVPSLPLYDRGWPLVHAPNLLGVRDNPNQQVDWNVEDWHWGS